MPRIARAVLPSVAHHVTQRGVGRGKVFFSDTDYQVYLEQVRQGVQRFGTELYAYCLSSNQRTTERCGGLPAHGRTPQRPVR
jgi:putative transposase